MRKNLKYAKNFFSLPEGESGSSEELSAKLTEGEKTLFRKKRANPIQLKKADNIRPYKIFQRKLLTIKLVSSILKLQRKLGRRG